MTTEDTLAARVTRGAALLDEKRPGWAAKIDTDRLQLHDCLNCTLGQLDGEYPHGRRALFGPEEAFTGGPLWEANHERARQHGFTIDRRDIEYSEDSDNEDAQWDPLTALWRSAILARREAKP